MIRKRSIFAGVTSYVGATIKDIISEIVFYKKITVKTIEELRSLKGKIRNDFDEVLANRIRAFIDARINDFSCYVADFNQLIKELPRKVTEGHCEILRQIFSDIKSGDELCYYFKEDCVKQFGRVLKKEEVDLILKVYGVTRDLFSDYLDISNLASRLDTFVGRNVKLEIKTSPLSEYKKPGEIKKLPEETKKSDAEKILETFDSIMIIPIKNNPSVLIFKMLGKPFYHKKRKGVVPDYKVAWKGKWIGHKFPKEIKQQYGKDFWKSLNAKNVDYKINDLPKGVKELSLNLVLGDKEIKMVSSAYITPVRNQLRQLGLIKELRGKIKPKEKIIVQRNEFIIAEYKRICKKTRKKKPLPIKKIQERWTDELSRLFPDEPQKADKYGVSDATIRRVLKNYIKK